MDDSEVVITNDSGDAGVRIQIHGNNKQRGHGDVVLDQECQTSLAFRGSDYEDVLSKAATPVDSGAKRKYTLEELEVEGFAPSSDGSTLAEEEESNFDLNSLIEGAVDEDEDEMEQPPTSHARSKSER